MDWFSALFLLAFTVSLVTGKAYFRGVIVRSEQPFHYWGMVAGYLALGLLTFYTPALKPVIQRFDTAQASHSAYDDSSALSFFSDLFTDAATRAAYDIEAGVAQLYRSGDNRHTLALRMKAEPEGCAEDYTVQINPGRALIIWCKQAQTGITTSSHSTSYHGRFVEGDQDWIVHKHAGEPVYVEIERGGGAKARILHVR